MSAFSFASLFSAPDFTFGYSNPQPSSAIGFTKFLMMPSFDVKGWEEDLVRVNQ